MYVGYHDPNNVSNVGGDPVTQLNWKKTFLFMKLGSLLSARCRHRSMKSSSMEGHVPARYVRHSQLCPQLDVSDTNDN